MSAKNIGIISQARMNSTRLPKKIFKKVNNKHLLDYHIERLKQTDNEIIIATTTHTADDVIQQYAEEKNIKFHRGSEDHVLSRYYETALKYKLDIIVRVTSDCPLIDPLLIKNGIEKYIELNHPKVYLSNVIERTFARGFDFEIFSFQLLKEAFLHATALNDIEHVTPYIWKNRSGDVKFHHVVQKLNNSRLRVTVDTDADFELIKLLIEKYSAHLLSSNEIETLLLQKPELVAINAHIEQKKI